MVAGRQCRMLQPYMNRSIGSPGAVKASATRSSAIRTLPPSAEQPAHAAQHRDRVAHVVEGLEDGHGSKRPSGRSSSAASPTLE